MVEMKIRLINRNCLPVKAHSGDAGFDCRIRAFGYIEGNKIKELSKKTLYILLPPMKRVLCKLGFTAAIPEGYYAQLVPRSGLALKEGLTILNAPATIDSGYRGEWGAIIINLSGDIKKLKLRQNICQMIIRKVENFEFDRVVSLPASERGEGGFGSTGE